jgi:hypothetical protein
MRIASLVAVLGLLVAREVAAGALNRNYLVPAYDACPGSGNCNPPTRSSPFTFDSIILYSSAKPYTGPGKLALQVRIKGLKDGSGSLFTGTVKLSVGKSRVTILTNNVGTLGETSPLVPDTTYNIPVENGAARFKYNTPDNTPERGLVVNSLGTPTLTDPDGNAIATTGTQGKP